MPGMLFMRSPERHGNWNMPAIHAVPCPHEALCTAAVCTPCTLAQVSRLGLQCSAMQCNGVAAYVQLQVLHLRSYISAMCAPSHFTDSLPASPDPPCCAAHLPAQLQELRLRCDIALKEKDFYYSKLRAIEVLCNTPGVADMPVRDMAAGQRGMGCVGVCVHVKT